MSRALTALVVFFLTVLFALSPFVTSGFRGFDPNQFPIPQIDPPVQPEGYAFAIWSVIYLWLLTGMGFGLWKRREDAQWQAMRIALIPSIAVGTIWISVAQRNPVWAAILIWVMLISALIALFRSPVQDRWFAALPLGLYAGWLSAASCVSLGLLSAGYGYLDQVAAALAALLLALVMASGIQSQLGRAPSYGIGVIWALVAIVVQNGAGNSTVAALAAGGALALTIPTLKAWRAQS